MRARELQSGQNRRVRRVRKLQSRRQREQLGLFAAEGPHVVEMALERGAPVSEVFCTAGFLGRHAALGARLEGSGWPVWVVGEGGRGELAAPEHSQGVVAVVGLLADAAVPRVSEGLLVLALEGVGDPGNVGTALRVAHAAGATAVVLGPGCCDRFNAKAVRGSAGSVFAVPALRTGDLAGLLGELRRGGALAVAAESGAATECWDAVLTGPTVVVVGSEARGLRAETMAAADVRVAVPMPGGAESLNAGVAAALLLYEAVRQRGVGRDVSPGMRG